jgi:hypothetical protein
MTIPVLFPMLAPNAYLFFACPSGNSYTADANGLIYNVLPVDQAYLIGRGCSPVNPRDNTDATRDPTVTDDQTALYGPGSFWFNVSTTTPWWCTSGATGAAAWTQGALGLPNGMQAYVTPPSDEYPSIAVGYDLDWPMAWRGCVFGYLAAEGSGSAQTEAFGNFSTDTNLQQQPAKTPVLVAAGYSWEMLDHVAAFGERAGRGAWAYSGTFIGQQAGYFALTYAPVLVGKWAGYGAVGAQFNCIGYECGAYANSGGDATPTTLTSAITSTATGSVAVGSASAWAPGTLGYLNGTLIFEIDQEVLIGHYVDATHVSLDVRGAAGTTPQAHAAGAIFARAVPAAQNNYLGWQAGKYASGGNNDLHGHQAGYQGSFHDSSGFGYQALYVSVGYNLVDIGSRANQSVAGHDSVAVGSGATVQALGTPFTVTTGSGNRTFDISNAAGAPSQNIAIPTGTGAANGWTSGAIVNLLWSYSGTYAPVHLESTNTAYLFRYFNAGGGNEYLLPVNQVWYWNGSATSDANPGDDNPPVGGNNVASWPSPENPAVTLYQPVGTVTLTPIVAVNEATAIGSAATAPAQNAVAIGAGSNANNTNAVAVGQSAAAAGDHSSAFGTGAAASQSYAQAFGYASSVSGSSGVAVGANVTVAGSNSVGIGKSASAAGGDAVAIGASASAAGVDGTAIGYGSSAGYSNSTAIGYQAAATNSNSVTLGNGSISHIYAQVTSITAISDRRLKQDIHDSDLGLDFIAKLKPVSYRFRNEDKTRRYGFIAQDAIEALPAALRGMIFAGDRGLALLERGTDTERTWRMNYGELIAPLVRAVQELADDVASLRRDNADLRARLEKK